MKDYSKTLSVRMTDDEYDRLTRYVKLTHLPLTTYFRFLIQKKPIRTRSVNKELNPHPGANMIISNVRQICINPYAKKIDERSVKMLQFLSSKFEQEVFLLVTQQ